MNHLGSGDRVFIHVQKSEHLLYFKLESSAILTLHLMSVENMASYRDANEFGADRNIVDFYDLPPDIDVNNTTISNISSISINLKPPIPFYIILENNTKETSEFSVEMEEIEYIPARTERRQLRISDLPF